MGDEKKGILYLIQKETERERESWSESGQRWDLGKTVG